MNPAIPCTIQSGLLDIAHLKARILGEQQNYIVVVPAATEMTLTRIPKDIQRRPPKDFQSGEYFETLPHSTAKLNFTRLSSAFIDRRDNRGGKVKCQFIVTLKLLLQTAFEISICV
jgi:hypothetical protein